MGTMRLQYLNVDRVVSLSDRGPSTAQTAVDRDARIVEMNKKSVCRRSQLRRKERGR